MTKDDKFEILDLIEDVLTRCEESIYKPESETYHSVVNPEKARKAIQAIKDSLNYRGRAMKLLAALMAFAICVSGEAGETSITTKFGNGTLTRRSNGDRIVIQRFGNGTLSRETFRGGKQAVHLSQPFGRGTITRSSGYLRKSPK